MLFIDCQTTGMQPSVGYLLEIAWGWGRAQDKELQSLTCRLVQLPPGATIPVAVQSLTGILESDLQAAVSPAQAYQDFVKDFERENQNSTAIIHYAQFEKSFLKNLFLRFSGTEDLPFEVLCSQALAKKVFPQLPSRNIRGLVGHFGSSLGELKRAASHVQATFMIWQGLVAQLQLHELTELESLANFLKARADKPKDAKSARYQYKIDEKIRLSLPRGPGIYKMINKQNDILYIGKATSLRDRVNSYFRGKKGRDKRKLEMLVQVWDLQFVETETVLQAAVLESDEIKRVNPPYNISLKSGRRTLTFYSKDFALQSGAQTEVCPLGPFRPYGNLEQLRIFVESEKMGFRLPFFYDSISDDLTISGFEIFCQTYNLKSEDFSSLRSCLAIGLRLQRKMNSDLEVETESEALLKEDFTAESAEEIEMELTPQDVSEKFERLFLRAAFELRKSRMLTRLLNCQISWESEVGWRTLTVHAGKIQGSWKGHPPKCRWAGLGIVDYDRMSILLSEILKRRYHLKVLFEEPPAETSENFRPAPTVKKLEESV